VLNNTVIGSGAFSEVRLAQNVKTEELIAAKITDLTKYRRYYDKEVKALIQIPPHPNIVPLVQYGEDGNTGYIFTELVKGCPLGNFVEENGTGNGIGEQESLEILLQIVNGIDAVHKAGFAHNDLKPENIIYNMETKTAHIIDFGLSSEVGPDGNVTECCGSPYYMSPEVITGRKRHNAFLSDIWSLGLIFYFMLVGNLPWSKTENYPELLKHILNGKLTIPSTISTATRQLLSGMLQLSPRARWSLQKIKEFILKALELLKRKAKSVRIVTLYSLL
jgi:serine/threonine protein kinase